MATTGEQPPAEVEGEQLLPVEVEGEQPSTGGDNTSAAGGGTEVYSVPVVFQGDRKLEVFTEVPGHAVYGEGPGADMVPYAVGRDGVQTVASLGAKSSVLGGLSVLDRVLFIIDGLSEEGAGLARSVVERLEQRGGVGAVTHAAVMKALHGYAAQFEENPDLL